MLKEFIKQNKLTCSKSKLQDYLDNFDISTINIKTSKHTFDEKYNWVDIKNEANGKYYYLINVWGMQYLQPFTVWDIWFVPLNDDNIDEAIENHKQELIQNIKFQKAITEFSSK